MLRAPAGRRRVLAGDWGGAAAASPMHSLAAERRGSGGAVATAAAAGAARELLQAPSTSFRSFIPFTMINRASAPPAGSSDAAVTAAAAAVLAAAAAAAEKISSVRPQPPRAPAHSRRIPLCREAAVPV